MAPRSNPEQLWYNHLPLLNSHGYLLRDKFSPNSKWQQRERTSKIDWSNYALSNETQYPVGMLLFALLI